MEKRPQICKGVREGLKEMTWEAISDRKGKGKLCNCI